MQITGTHLQKTQTLSKTAQGSVNLSKSEAPDSEPREQFTQSEPVEASWKQAAGVVGRSMGRGAIDGVGLSFIRSMAYAAGGPAAGAVATLAISGLGAAVCIADEGDRFSEQLDSKIGGKLLAGVIGASKNFLISGGFNANPDFAQSMIGGAALGAVFGLIESPRQA